MTSTLGGNHLKSQNTRDFRWKSPEITKNQVILGGNHLKLPKIMWFWVEITWNHQKSGAFRWKSPGTIKNQVILGGNHLKSPKIR